MKKLVPLVALCVLIAAVATFLAKPPITTLPAEIPVPSGQSEDGGAGSSAEPVPDIQEGLWSAPTDTGLADTSWALDGWVLALQADGTAILSDDGAAYTGSWQMADDCLRLSLTGSAGDPLEGAYPAVIDLSGEHLRLEADPAGASLPFLTDGSGELILS